MSTDDDYAIVQILYYTHIMFGCIIQHFIEMRTLQQDEGINISIINQIQQ